ncbi:MAG: AAA family ATPase [Dysosmobacter sp.]
MDEQKREELLAQQMEVIRRMTEHNLARMGQDFWGAPLPSEPSSVKEPTAPEKPRQSADAAPTPAGDPQPQEAAVQEPEPLETILAELDGYIGLAAVKEEVHNLINLVRVHQMRRAHDLPTPELSLHMVFSGNPGTGKTTVARIMARVYHTLGILSKGQLVEVDRSGLVAGYVGQTSLKTTQVIEKALGGVLFIDEAYALSGKGGQDFGQEAIDTILKAMEDHRDDLVVIVAGYEDLMEDFIHSNPGLESRFNRFLHFADYTVEELCAIFDMQCRKGCYTLTPEARNQVRRALESADTDGISFGNARGVRNLFERVLVQQANRLASADAPTREMLMELTGEDVAAAAAGMAEANVPKTES